MAPQLGMGTFRIEQNGMTTAFASSQGNSDGDKEKWALRRDFFIMPSQLNPMVTMQFHYLGPYNGDICQVVQDNGGIKAEFDWIVHTKDAKGPC